MKSLTDYIVEAYEYNYNISNVSNVLDMRDMFYGCNKLTIPAWYNG